VGLTKLSNNGGTRSIAIDAAQRDRMPCDAAACICTSVDGIDDDNELIAKFGRR